MNISGIVTTGHLGADVTINGSGFGASQGTTVIQFYPSTGGYIASGVPTSWSDTVIHVPVPMSAAVGLSGYFFIQKSDGTPGVRSVGFPILAATVSPETLFNADTVVTAQPGLMGLPPWRR